MKVDPKIRCAAKMRNGKRCWMPGKKYVMNGKFYCHVHHPWGEYRQNVIRKQLERR